MANLQALGMIETKGLVGSIEAADAMGLQPRTINALLKKELAKRKIRYPASQERFEPRPEREGRKIPTERAAARTGVHEFYHLEIKNCAEDSPGRVEIPLSMI